MGSFAGHGRERTLAVSVLPMRLLLLLSALFTALAGITGTRAEAQPVQASALASASIAAAVATPSAAIRFAMPSFGRVPPAMPALPRLVGAAAARLLYAERRRE